MNVFGTCYVWLASADTFDSSPHLSLHVCACVFFCEFASSGRLSVTHGSGDGGSATAVWARGVCGGLPLPDPRAGGPPEVHCHLHGFKHVQL